jgi:hypothetical protein
LPGSDGKSIREGGAQLIVEKKGIVFPEGFYIYDDSLTKRRIAK